MTTPMYYVLCTVHIGTFILRSYKYVLVQVSCFFIIDLVIDHDFYYSCAQYILYWVDTGQADYKTAAFTADCRLQTADCRKIVCCSNCMYYLGGCNRMHSQSKEQRLHRPCRSSLSMRMSARWNFRATSDNGSPSCVASRRRRDGWKLGTVAEILCESWCSQSLR